MYGILHLCSKRFQNEIKIMKYLSILDLLYFVVVMCCGHYLAEFWLVVCTIVIRAYTGIQFALVCPTEFEFLLVYDRWNLLRSLWMSTSSKQWHLAYKWLGLWHHILCEDLNMIHLCCKCILKVGFLKIFKF